MSTKEEMINAVWERIFTQVIPKLEQTPHNWGGPLFELPLTAPYPAARFTICVLASRESTPEKHLHIYLTSDTDGVITFAETTLEKDSVVTGMEGLISDMDNFWNDESLKVAWEFFGDIPMDANECMEEPFLHFPAGTHREEIWRWFDGLYSKGVHALLYPHEYA